MPKHLSKFLVIVSLACILSGGTLIALEKTTPAAPPAAPQQQGVTITIDEVVASGLSLPVQLTHAGDGSGRLFVVEQGGAIRIIDNGTVLSTPFLDIDSLVRTDGEQGLLGLAFHPDYASNGYFYVNYTNNSGNTVIARYQVSANPNVADSVSAQILLTVNQPASNHNGGQVAFGPDGYLYIGMGDGGSAGDPDNEGQDKDTLLGAMLRIDVNTPSGYLIPADNPFVGVAGRDEIWAIGLRNPWRFSFDRQTGDLYIGDVGQNNWEEISYQKAGTPGGLNFGWDCLEGTHSHSNAAPVCSTPGLIASMTPPIAEYSHSEGLSVSGGFVYRGQDYQGLTGRYFYADYVFGKIWSLTKTGTNPDTFSAPDFEMEANFNISAFGEDEQGELYVVDYSGGTIRRLADAAGPTPVPNLSTSSKKSSTDTANPGEVVTYTIRLVNTGDTLNSPLYLTDTLPVSLTYVSGSLNATSGTTNDSAAPTLRWSGDLNFNAPITITYRVTVAAGNSSSQQIFNQAQLNGPDIAPLTLTHVLFTPRSILNTTLNNFIVPGTQPNALTDTIPDPATCNGCHTAPIFDSWRGSMMGQAARDPLMWAALTVAEKYVPNAGEYCLRCHSPKGWLEGRSHPTDGSALESVDLRAGVACEICHRMVDPVPSTTDQAVSFDAGIRASLTEPLPTNHIGSGMMIIDPQDRRRGPFSLPGFSLHSAYRTDFLGQSTNYVTESRVCGTCHNVDNPVLSWDEGRGEYWPNDPDTPAASFENEALFPIERTFDEWQNSTYAATGVYAPQFAGQMPDGVVGSCQDCHMKRITGSAADNFGGGNPVERDCETNGCLPEHTFVGGNTWVPQLLQDSRWRLNSVDDAPYLNNTIIAAREMLKQAATLTATLVTSGTGKAAIVRVTNETGHKLPTGYPEGRRMWINLKAFDQAGNLVYESGAYNANTAVLTQDGSKIYEAKQGLTSDLADFLGMPEGASFHFVLNNTTVKDNRIPPRGFTNAAFDKRGLRPVGATYVDGQYWDETVYPLPENTARVLATLYYQTSSKEYIDFLRNNGGIDGVTVGTLWDGSKSLPEVMAIAFDPAHNIYLPLVIKQ